MNPDLVLSKLQEDKETGCWIWPGALSSGYGRVRLPGNVYEYVHRISYVNAVGSIPLGMVIDHLCRVRACANPEHLEMVTAVENTLRGRVCNLYCSNGCYKTAKNVGRRNICKVCVRSADRLRWGKRKKYR